MNESLLKIARRIEAIAQTGLRFSTDVFDRQRFDELHTLSMEMYAQLSDASIEKIKGLFAGEKGFQTPKIDIRAVVLNEKGHVLLTNERSDGCWALPGGYADVNYTPRTIAEKEVWEETGLKVKANRLLGIFDTDFHDFPPLEFHFYKLVILCDYIDGTLRDSEETLEARYFDFGRLPELSVKRNTYAMLNILQEILKNGNLYID